MEINYIGENALHHTIEKVKDKVEEHAIDYSLDESGEGLTIKGGFSSSGGSKHNYSTEEQVIGTWIDGNQIYEIVGKLPNNAELVLSANNTNQNSKGYIFTNGLIPKLTSNDSASDTVGVSICSAHTSVYDSWMAFDNDKTTGDDCWYKDSKPCWLGFRFNEPKVVRFFFLRQEHVTPEYIENFKFQASNDGDTWVDLGNYIMSERTPGYEEGFDVDNDTPYTYYRWYFIDGPSGGISVQLAQMYNRNVTIYQYTKITD